MPTKQHRRISTSEIEFRWDCRCCPNAHKKKHTEKQSFNKPGAPDFYCSVCSSSSAVGCSCNSSRSRPAPAPAAAAKICCRSMTSSDRPDDRYDYKLISDPFLRPGHRLLYRYHEPFTESEGPVDPRAKQWLDTDGERRRAGLPIPNFKVDAYWVGPVPSRRVLFTNLSTEFDSKTFQHLCERFGPCDEAVLYPPVEKGEGLVGKAVFKSACDAKECVSTIDDQLVLNRRVQSFFDPFGLYDAKYKAKFKFLIDPVSKGGSIGNQDGLFVNVADNQQKSAASSNLRGHSTYNDDHDVGYSDYSDPARSHRESKSNYHYGSPMQQRNMHSVAIRDSSGGYDDILLSSLKRRHTSLERGSTEPLLGGADDSSSNSPCMPRSGRQRKRRTKRVTIKDSPTIERYEDPEVKEETKESLDSRIAALLGDRKLNDDEDVRGNSSMSNIPNSQYTMAQRMPHYGYQPQFSSWVAPTLGPFFPPPPNGFQMPVHNMAGYMMPSNSINHHLHGFYPNSMPGHPPMMPQYFMNFNGTNGPLTAPLIEKVVERLITELAGIFRTDAARRLISGIVYRTLEEWCDTQKCRAKVLDLAGKMTASAQQSSELSPDTKQNLSYGLPKIESISDAINCLQNGFGSEVLANFGIRSQIPKFPSFKKQSSQKPPKKSDELLSSTAVSSGSDHLPMNNSTDEKSLQAQPENREKLQSSTETKTPFIGADPRMSASPVQTPNDQTVVDLSASERLFSCPADPKTCNDNDSCLEYELVDDEYVDEATLTHHPSDPANESQSLLVQSTCSKESKIDSGISCTTTISTTEKNLDLLSVATQPLRQVGRTESSELSVPESVQLSSISSRSTTSKASSRSGKRRSRKPRVRVGYRRRPSKAQKRVTAVKKFQSRCEEEEQRNVGIFLSEGIDDEDIMFLRLTYERLLESPNCPEWLNDTNWVNHPPTFVGGDINPYKQDESTVGFELSPGCARTRQYKRFPPEGKTNKAFPTELTIKLMIRCMERRKNSANSISRGARSKQRRMTANIGDSYFAEIFRFSQLKSRKKSLQFAPSKIHDWGLYACEFIASEEMVIEYVGETIRPTVADSREQRQLNETGGQAGTSYLFRVDSEIIIDATKCGNPARFINHSCDPNCYAKIITFGSVKKVVIYSKRDIQAGEEITYDYKFPLEDKKIPCNCGASTCRKTLN